jgi:hypothetical protein
MRPVETVDIPPTVQAIPAALRPPCWRPELKNRIMVNSILSDWRMEDVWLDRYISSDHPRCANSALKIRP